MASEVGLARLPYKDVPQVGYIRRGAKPGHDGGEAGPYGKYPRQLICCATGSDVATLFHRNSRTGRSIEQPPEVEGRKLILRVLADVSCEGPNCAWIDGF